jgi:hypothetical protein
MNHVVDAAHCHAQPLEIANVSQEESDPVLVICREPLAHLILLQLIARENNHSAGVVFAQ